RRYGVAIEPDWVARIEPVLGDLAEPDLGLDAETWQRLAESVDAIYHLGASVSVIADYATHRTTNVDAIVPVVRLATAADRLRPVFFTSPMSVSRRHIGGELTVLPGE